MRYTHPQRYVLMNDPRFLNPRSKAQQFDPYAYAGDLFYIDAWLTEHFYPELDLSEPIHYTSRLDMAALVLSRYVSSPEWKDDYDLNHWKCLEQFLCRLSELDHEEEGSFYDLLAGL